MRACGRVVQGRFLKLSIMGYKGEVEKLLISNYQLVYTAN